jgi:Acyl-CoA thioesterase C-terminal domain/Acyl-CoA thioesterase N-terminal domain
MDSAFYVSDGDRFVSSELTRGPWDPDSQHAGPPAALIARELERMDPDSEWQIGRITFEILKPVPIAPLAIHTEIVRPGKSVQLLTASLSSEEGEVIRASAWRLARRELELPAGIERGEREIPGPEQAQEEEFFATGQDVGYHTAMEYRFVSGRFLEAGPATVWMRMRYPLVEGEEPTPLQRVLAAADSGNGVSATLDWSRYLFINVDLSVHLHRLPAGEWVCLDAITIPEPDGVGLADTALYDETGSLGRALQTLLVRAREA